jgi:8-oxo-dGTP pyrophosphatase MutT (NUDIX family)
MIDAGETADAAARRELLEETGFTAAAAGAGASEHDRAAGVEQLLPTSICWPDPWKSKENYFACQLIIDGDAAENQAGARASAQALEEGETIVPILAPADHQLLP